MMEIPASNLLIAALAAIEEEIYRITGNQGNPISPMGNTGQSFECPVFRAEAYDWAELELPDDVEIPEQVNFKWRDLEVCWYKYLGRGTYTNRVIEPGEIGEMLEDCLKELLEYERSVEE